MPIEDTTNSYEYKLKKAGLAEPLTTYLADPYDEDRLAAGFPAYDVNSSNGGTMGLVGADGDIYIPEMSSKLKKWRKAVAGVLAGVSNAKLAFVGDSTSAGLATVGSNPVSFFTQSPAYAAITQIGKTLAPVNFGAVFGDPTRNNPVGAFAQFDNRVVAPSWVQTAFTTAGGNAFGNSTTTGSLSFTPTAQFDTFDIYSINNTGGYGQWTVNIDGGASLATVDNANAVRSIRKTTLSCPLGTHTINIQRNGVGGQVFIIGIATRNSTQKTIDLYQLAYGSATTSEWATGTASIGSPQALQIYAPDLTVIDLGINTRRLSLYTSSFDADIQAVVNAAKASGDVILCIPAPSDFGYSAFTTPENISNFNSAIRRVAQDNDLLLFNKEHLLGSYIEGNALGIYNDTLHPNNIGYTLIGTNLGKAISRL